MQGVKMKRIICLGFMLSVLRFAFCANLKIINNTDKTEVVKFGFSNNGFILQAGKSIELICDSDRNTFSCSYGVMSFNHIDNDTTLEINPDCFYIGETKMYYWNEGR